jgi:hypothetical protein
VITYVNGTLYYLKLNSLITGPAARRQVKALLKWCMDVIKDLHEQVSKRIEKQNQKYERQANKHRRAVIFKEGDLVWMHLSKERFSLGRNVKLKHSGDGPLFTLEKSQG